MLKFFVDFIEDCLGIIKEVIIRPTENSFIILKTKNIKAQADGNDSPMSFAGMFDKNTTTQEEQIKELTSRLDKLEKKNSQDEISYKFKYLFIGIFILTLASLIVALVISFRSSLSDEGKQLFAICTTVFKGGVGAMIGLIGGKLT